jgi:hypothetical protein
MVSGGQVKRTELIARALFQARGSGATARYRSLKRMFLLHELIVRLGQLRSPRYYYVSSDLPSQSFWAHLRSTRRSGAWMRFLGFPPLVFDMLAHAMRPYLAKYDPELQKHRKGRRTRLDYYDVCAVVLRRLQIAGPLLKFLEQDFAVVDSVLAGVDGVIEHGRHALHAALQDMHDARICYPTKEEGERVWAGVTSTSRIGPPPWGTACKPFLLLMDGTVTRVHSVSNEEIQRLYLGVKGRVMNHILVFSAEGCVVDYNIGLPGCTHDATACTPCVEHHQDPEINPHGWGMVVDSGFKGVCRNTEPMIVRGLMTEAVEVSKKEWLEKCSKWLTSYRQYNEHGNGGLKRAFIRLNEPVHVSASDQFKVDMVSCLHLFNLRSRVIGFNEVRTSVMGQCDANLRDMLAANNNIDTYIEMCAQRWRDALNDKY